VNPYTRSELRELTGEDEAVVDFMERASQVQEYWENVRGIVELQVEDYVSRRFGSLTVSFGCTGGQHRSVFMAGKLAAFLRDMHPHVDVRLAHRKLDQVRAAEGIGGGAT
jgi:RNase adaptor protein for sRNA GlmZ degradation